jgi:hypothetical protein
MPRLKAVAVSLPGVSGKNLSNFFATPRRLQCLNLSRRCITTGQKTTLLPGEPLDHTRAAHRALHTTDIISTILGHVQPADTCVDDVNEVDSLILDSSRGRSQTRNTGAAAARRAALFRAMLVSRAWCAAVLRHVVLLKG